MASGVCSQPRCKPDLLRSTGGRGENIFSFSRGAKYIFEVTSRTRETATSLPDFWSLGVLVYELLVGSPPFSSSEPQKIYSKILDGVVKFPPHMSEAARSLISKLCRPRPGQRLGNTKNGIKDVRHHRWFSTVNWHKLRMGQGPCYINFDRFPHDKTQAEEEFSGWDKDF
ncbi:hypothetical protein AALO_G00119090 [Alosa alosa]|uniref:Protein kinase domain-containing protein n=1 Tax=Alosa alosa TaxID=278164 RepID=A0AAV6GW10_9TELE|nr:hypothetical protein AALO_G00119090 [Alosa alosa]